VQEGNKYGIITFKYEAGAKEAVDELQHKDFDGNKLKVTFYQKKNNG